MDGDFVMYIGRRTMEAAIALSAPVLVVTLVLGLATSVLQAITAIKDQTISLVLKLVGVAVTLIICGNWMIQLAVNFTAEMFSHLQRMGR